MTGPEGRVRAPATARQTLVPGSRTDKRFRGSSALAHDWPSQDHGFGLYISNKPQSPVMEKWPPRPGINAKLPKYGGHGPPATQTKGKMELLNLAQVHP